EGRPPASGEQPCAPLTPPGEFVQESSIFGLRLRRSSWPTLAGRQMVDYSVVMSVAEIQKNVSGLPEKERAKLAAWLLDSLPPSSSDDAGDESAAEAARRREELDSGRVQPVNSEEFWKDVDQEREQWR